MASLFLDPLTLKSGLFDIEKEIQQAIKHIGFEYRQAVWAIDT